MKEIQEKVRETFLKAFRRTPLTKRLKDILGEAQELDRFTDMKNLREETGDLLSSVLQLCNECDWDAEQLIDENLAKIQRRIKQYQSLGRKISAVVIGGAFDPIHNGHINLAQFLLNVGVFDEAWIMPCFSHLYDKKMAPPEHRLEMCRLAAKQDGRIKVSDYEIKKQLSGETYNLATHLLAEFSDEYDFSFAIGMDNANTFDKWVNYTELERMVRFVVLSRVGTKPAKGVDWYLKPPHLYFDMEGVREISSTYVKERLIDLTSEICRNAALRELNELLNPDVIKYIQEHLLYQDQKRHHNTSITFEQ